MEDSVASLTRDKTIHFEELQQQQATFESSQSHLETLQAENADLQFRLRDALDRASGLSDELVDLQRRQDEPVGRSTSSPLAEDVAQLLSDAETRHELKIAELKRVLSSAEKERNESEAQWSKRLRERVQESDDLRRTLGSAGKLKDEEEEAVSSLRGEVQRLTGVTVANDQQIATLTKQIERMVELHVGHSNLSARIFIADPSSSRPFRLPRTNIMQG